MESNDLAWSGQSWRLPLWLWLGLAAMAVGTLHILLDFGVGLFPLRGRLSLAVGATLLLVSLIHVWWSVSLAAGAHGNGGGVASVAILGLGWTLLINGYPIVYCPPLCPYAAPLSDVVHVGSLVLGIAAPAAAGAGGLGVTRRGPGARGSDGMGAIQSGRCVVRLAILPRHPLL